MEHVIYKETTQLYTSVSTGEADVCAGQRLPPPGPLQRAGKLRSGRHRAQRTLPASPMCPPWAESGGPKGFEVTGWNAIAVPPGLPAAVTDKIRKDIEQALAGPMCKEKFKTLATSSSPPRAQFAQFVKDESQRFGDVIKKANVSLD